MLRQISLLPLVAALCLATGGCTNLPTKVPAPAPTIKPAAEKIDRFGEVVDLYQHNQWARCIRKAPVYIKNNNHVREARWILARSYVACNEPENALPVVDAALAGEPENIDLMALKVDILQRLRRPKEALELCRKALLKADRYDLHLAAGQLGLIEKQYDQAKSNLLRALNTVPPQLPIAKAVIYDGLAQICSAKGDHAEALKNLKAALALDPRGAGGIVQAHQVKEFKAISDHKSSAAAAQESIDLGYQSGTENQPLSVCLNNSFSPDHQSFKHRLDTRHLIILSNTGGAALKSYGEDAELFLRFLDKKVCKLTAQYPVCVYAWDNCKQHQKYIANKTERRVSTSNLGQTSERLNLISTCGLSYRSTLFHELTHNALLDYGLRFYPWAQEGIPRALETVYGYRQGGHAVLYSGFEAPTMARQLPPEFIDWKFSDIICRTPSNRQQGAQALAGSFLLERGKLKRYLDLGQLQLKGKYDTYVEAAFDLPAAELDPFFSNYIKNLAKRLPAVTAYPVSAILPNQAAFRLFIKKHKISLAGLTPVTLPLRGTAPAGP